MAIVAVLPGHNLFSSPPPNPRINESLPSTSKPPSPPIPIPKYLKTQKSQKSLKSSQQYDKPPDKSANPAFKAVHRRTKYYKPVTDGVIASEEGRSAVIGESGVSYLLPGAPFEFQFSYSETPKVKPLAIREPAFLPFAPPTMPRPWTGKSPLKQSKKKIRLLESFNPPPPETKGLKRLEMPRPFSLAKFPNGGKTREEVLGKPLTKSEIRMLVKPHLAHNRQVNVGRDGLTHNMLELIHSHWRRESVCKVRCRGVPTVDMNNVCHHLEEKTGGKIIHQVGGFVYLFRGRNYDYKTRPRYPTMLWKPAAPVYPKLIQEVPEGLTKVEADDLRVKGKNLLPICKLAKNGVYINLVKADSMKVFWRFLLQKHLSQHWLKGVQYAVFGLGDSGYQKYNFVAKKLDKRLLDLGAKAIIEKGLGDDQHPSGYEGALDPWLSSLWNMLNQMNPMMLPRCPEIIGPDTKMMDLPKFKIMYHEVDRMQSLFSTSSDLNDMKVRIESARSMSAGKIFHDKNRPHCFLQMIKNQQLTKEGCGKDVQHFEFEALSSDIQYGVGDFLEILPSQDPVAVDAFIQCCNLNPDSYITVQHRGTDNYLLDSHTNASRLIPVKLKTFVELTMDIASASPRRYFFEVMSFFATAEHEKERLQYFASPEGRDDLYQYNQKERRTVLEVLEDFPSVQMPFEWLVQLVPPLKTRAFSISSSPFVHPNQVHLTVDVVSWTTPYKRKRRGLCSNWLAGIDPQKTGTQIPVWFHKGSLPSPSPSLPLILIGPGTGCAPFRAFVEERSMQSESEPTTPILFFFGCRNKENDFLYRDFWLSHARCGGVLSEETGGGFFVAFSRDQPHKIYVQHKMREASDRIWSLLSSGAAIYVAGSANKMPADVLACVEEIVSTKSGLPKESAVSWVRALERAGRYHVEAWS